jgi:hypothetical protein
MGERDCLLLLINPGTPEARYFAFTLSSQREQLTDRAMRVTLLWMAVRIRA